MFSPFTKRAPSPNPRSRGRRKQEIIHSYPSSLWLKCKKNNNKKDFGDINENLLLPGPQQHGHQLGGLHGEDRLIPAACVCVCAHYSCGVGCYDTMKPAAERELHATFGALPLSVFLKHTETHVSRTEIRKHTHKSDKCVIYPTTHTHTHDPSWPRSC